MTTSSSTERLHSFHFTATIKLTSTELKVNMLQETYPGATSAAFTSRTFETYDECVSSCKSLMDDFLKRANGRRSHFKMGSEVNPIHSGQQTLSKDWAHGEVSRLWIYDKKMEQTGHIHAIGQARIFGQTGPKTISTLPN